MGFQLWNEIRDVSPVLPGDFESSGINLGGAAHWRMRETSRHDLFLGLDLGYFTNPSNIGYRNGDLAANVLYVTPSVKLLFDRGSGPTYSMDFGLGYYFADITETELVLYSGYSETRFWDDSAFGGYLGGSVSFPSEKRKRRGGFTASAKIHMFDFGPVRDEDDGRLFPVLGPDAGNLAGPLLMFQFGYHWY